MSVYRGTGEEISHIVPLLPRQAQGGEPFEPQSSYNSVQAAVISDIRDLVEELPEVPSSGMEASFCETLRGRAGYPADTAQGVLAP